MIILNLSTVIAMPKNTILEKLFKLYSDLITYDLLIEANLWEADSLRTLQDDTFAECERLHADFFNERGYDYEIEEGMSYFMFIIKDPNENGYDEVINELYQTYREAWNHVHKLWKSVVQ